MGTRALKALRHLDTWALGHSRHLDTWALSHSKWTQALGHLKETWAFRHSRHLGTWLLRHLGTWTLGHSDTRTLRHSSTWALEALEELYIADSEHSPNESKTNMFSTNNSRGCQVNPTLCKQFLYNLQGQVSSIECLIYIFSKNRDSRFLISQVPYPEFLASK